MDKKIKIAFLSRYVGSVNRGVESYVLELSKRLEERGFEVSVFSGKKADSISVLLKNNFDVVIPTNGRFQAFKASLARIFKGYKIIISGQAGIGRDDLWNILVTRPNVYVALTDVEKQWAEKWAKFLRVVKIPNGVDLDKYRGKSGFEIDLNKPIILSVGALEWYKHHERSIQAVSQLKEGSLLIVGKGSLESELKELGEKLLGKERFKIINVNFEKIPEVYKKAKVFVLPSWDREAFGIVYVEAMAADLPVVAPDDSVRREIIGKAGIFTDVTDPSKYAFAISTALKLDWENKPKLQAEKFSWDKIADEYEQLIKKIIK